jgi:cytidyltransferase-like protein
MAVAGKKQKKIVVAVSGGFDPIHIGHVRMFEHARALGDELVVILNNDNWLQKKKHHVFMPEGERKEIIEALRPVDRVVLTSHGPDPKDMSVCAELEKIKPDIFAQGGDRNVANIPPCEVELREKLGFKILENVGRGGKVQSSSWLLEKYAKRVAERNL